MFGLGPLELIILALALLLLFGAKRITSLIGSFGRGIREFRNNLGSDKDPPHGLSR